MRNKDRIPQPQKQLASVVVEGIDTSSPDDLVKDGKCEELHNLRYKNNAWRPVNMHKILHDVASAMEEDFLTQYEIVYHHPVAGKNIFIALQQEGAEHRFYVVDLSQASVTLFASELIYTASDIDISHFGKVLMIHVGYNTRKFLYSDSAYEEWVQPEAPIVTVEEGTKTPALPTHMALNFDERWDSTDNFDEQPFLAYWKLFDDAGNVIFPENDGNAWLGSLAFFASYRMGDGSNIVTSPIGILSSEIAVSESASPSIGTSGKRIFIWRDVEIDSLGYSGICSYLYNSNYGDSIPAGGPAFVIPATKTYYSQPQLHYFTPTLSINIPEGISSLIKSVAIYTTRIYFPFTKSYNPSTTMFAGTLASSASFNNVKLPEEPFYLCKEIPLSEFVDNSFELPLTYDLLSNITSKRLYTPTNNIHNHSSGTSFDYNNRLHLANYTTVFHQPNELLPLFVTDGGEDVDVNREVVATLKINGRRYNAVSGVITGRNSDISFIDGYKSIISYPDYRCEELLIIQRQENLTNPTYAIRQLTPAVNNNFAYYIVPDTGKALSYSTLRYTPISYSRDVLLHDISAPRRAYFHNQVIVSQPNNLFAFDFANTYALGSDNSTVLALQSAAIELSDTKYGEFPLYAFTTEGIYALQSGENTLYSSVLPINYDKITNKDVLAINYNLVYITSKGVHLLNSKGTTLISGPINDLAGNPLTILDEVKLLNPESFNEIVLYHEPSSKAYIYNLDFDYWSTRDMSGSVINDGKIVDGRYILDATTEDAERTPAECKILTRPAKLGNLEFKRLETIIPRISILEKDDTELDFLAQGTNNPNVDWTALRCYHATFDKQGLYPITLRRTPFSSKYIRFALEVKNDAGVGNFTFVNIDLEWYHKFLHRMR